MIKVWVLVAFIGYTHTGGPLVIDNIATQHECVRLADNIKYLAKNNPSIYLDAHTRCVEVWKIK